MTACFSHGCFHHTAGLSDPSVSIRERPMGFPEITPRLLVSLQSQTAAEPALPEGGIPRRSVVKPRLTCRWAPRSTGDVVRSTDLSRVLAGRSRQLAERGKECPSQSTRIPLQTASSQTHKGFAAPTGVGRVRTSRSAEAFTIVPRPTRIFITRLRRRVSVHQPTCSTTTRVLVTVSVPVPATVT